MKKKCLSRLFILLSVLFYSGAVYANSSWGWVDKRPFDLLPIVIILTLTIEVIMTINSLEKRNG